MLVWNTLKRTKWISLIKPKPNMTKILQVQQSTLKQYKQGQKLQRAEINPTINSLLSDELQQLCRLTHYSTSVSFLQKNQIQKSYNHLQFAFTEAKGNFPQSVNLHMFLKNRLSILEKILGKNQQFVANLEEIFFMCLSLKGEKSLETVKHLHNYMIALAIYDSAKLNSLIQYLHQSNMKLLLKKSEYFISLNRFFSGDQSQAIVQIDKIIGETQKNCNNVSMIDKMVNNVCWFKILSLTKQNLEIVPVEQHEKLNQILDQLIRCLLEAQKQGQLKADSAQIQKNLEMTNLLQQYLETKKTPLIKLKSKTLLLNSQSPIISMNIAHTLYLLQKYEQSSILMRIAIQTSIQLHQPYRLGLGLILLAKINHRLKLPYQDILVDMLNHSQRYSDAVVMECLFTYSRFLFMQMRYYQAESYVVQGESVRQKGKARMEIQGIVLPDFDFEF